MFKSVSFSIIFWRDVNDFLGFLRYILAGVNADHNGPGLLKLEKIPQDPVERSTPKVDFIFGLLTGV